MIHHAPLRGRNPIRACSAGSHQAVMGDTMSIAEAGYGPNLSRNFLDPEIVQRVLKISDFVVLFIGTAALALQSALALEPDSATMMTFGAMVMVFSSLLALRGVGAYDIRSLTQPVRSTLIATGFTILAGTAGFVLTRTFMYDLPAAWLAGWMLIPALHFSISRVATASWLKPRVANGMLRQRIAIVGGGKAAEEAINILEGSANLDIEIVGLFDDRDDERSPAIVAAIPNWAQYPNSSKSSAWPKIDMLIVSLPLSAESRVLELLKKLLSNLPSISGFQPTPTSFGFAHRSYSYEGSGSAFGRVRQTHRRLGWGYIMKRGFDILFSITALLLLAPVMIGAAIMIRIESKGPVLFRQKRYGFNNEVIEVLKFRSMFHEFADPYAKQVVTKNDPRVTRIRRTRRKTSIDELPQLFNVLRGKLRPHQSPFHAVNTHTQNRLWDEVVDGYFARHKVKPGVTGWAQINGWRGETDTHDKIANRVKYDLEYIDRWSIWLDLRIPSRRRLPCFHRPTRLAHTELPLLTRTCHAVFNLKPKPARLCAQRTDSRPPAQKRNSEG